MVRSQKDDDLKIPYGKRQNLTLFENSSEFTRLGTLAMENRIANYYQPDPSTQPRPLPPLVEEMLRNGK